MKIAAFEHAGEYQVGLVSQDGGHVRPFMLSSEKRPVGLLCLIAWLESGGELPALVVIDAISRLIPGVVGDEQSVEQDSFAGGVLDYPHYTRPAEFAGLKVPDVLLSGHHADVRRWRRKTALARTLERRPELLDDAALDDEDRALLDEIRTDSDK